MRWPSTFSTLIGTLALSGVVFAQNDSTLEEASTGGANKFYQHEPGYVRGRYAEYGWPSRQGVCGPDMAETMSGFINIGHDSIEARAWFWLSEAQIRPHEAPLVLYISDGPGIATSWDMLNGTGPCMVISKDKAILNPASFNRYVNILYIDNPIGTGFSYGNHYVDNSADAALDLARAINTFMAVWPRYKTRDFGIWALGRGAPTAVELARHLVDYNTRAGKELIRFRSLALDSPHLDLATQYKAMIQFGRFNRYKRVVHHAEYHELYREYVEKYEKRFKRCADDAFRNCLSEMANYEMLTSRLTKGRPRGLKKVDPWDMRRFYKCRDVECRSKDMTMNTATALLLNPEVQEKLGVRGGSTKLVESHLDYRPWRREIADRFRHSHDVMRSSVGELSKVVRAGIRTLIVGGDADFETNWLGLRNITEAIEFDGQEQFAKYDTLRMLPLDEGDLKPAMRGAVAEFQTVGNLTWMNFYDKGRFITKQWPEQAVELMRMHSMGMPFTMRAEHSLSDVPGSHDRERAVNITA